MNGKSDNKCLKEFEELNKTCDSIYNLGDHKVLILLKDGTNLTSWNEVENREDIIYISEDLSGVTDLSFRYHGLKSLKGIVAFGVGDNVKSMEYMFNKCYDLKDISSLKDWDVSGVTDMGHMFFRCSGLSDLSALAGWDVSGVTNMGEMFSKCLGLSDLSALAGWDVSGVTDMHHMFLGCSVVDLSALAGWDVSGVSNMEYMFNFCHRLEDISALAGWDVSGVADMHHMFEDCHRLEDISALVVGMFLV